MVNERISNSRKSDVILIRNHYFGSNIGKLQNEHIQNTPGNRRPI